MADLLVTAAIIALPVALVLWALLVLPGLHDPALALLRRRYAAGEVSREQFEEMRQVLAGQASRPPVHEPPVPQEPWSL